jgi:hypothetical protein
MDRPVFQKPLGKRSHNLLIPRTRNGLKRGVLKHIFPKRSGNSARSRWTLHRCDIVSGSSGGNALSPPGRSDQFRTEGNVNVEGEPGVRVVVCACLEGVPFAGGADERVLYNGKIFTGEPEHPYVKRFRRRWRSFSKAYRPLNKVAWGTA